MAERFLAEIQRVAELQVEHPCFPDARLSVLSCLLELADQYTDHRRSTPAQKAKFWWRAKVAVIFCLAAIVDFRPFKKRLVIFGDFHPMPSSLLLATLSLPL